MIDIAGWDIHQDYEVFPVGARDKSLRVSPGPAPFDFCLAGHRYLFKEAIKSAKNPNQPRHPDQYWAEVIAFRVGRLMGLTLPPVFVAIDSLSDEPGTVNEWFLGYNDENDERFFPGGDYMQRRIPDYDREKGKRHNLSTIITLSRVLERGGWLSHDWRLYWGLGLCFDALIGNTDRHQENWGLIWTEDSPTARFAPYFDNGTSLGHELQPEKMQRMVRDPNEFNAYLRRGEHQMRWSLGDERRLPSIQGIVRYCEHFPEIRAILIERLVGVCEDELVAMLHNLTCFDLPHPFTQQRAEFVAFLTLRRRERLLQALEN
ncbi:MULTISPECIES: hypothetical protein [unclassified Marinobacter]|uniref:hypothetical protein n=1 Tax=unclassified Marinobacter TaxID=83889 RepID=UPI00200DADB9|nr:MULTISPECIES: hypothetical protein [unclassified Marinobacter]UQG55376.1 hypothetical protein MIH16_18575 [Marinobacter sp. M4C]UQG64180.1 hypothetical protein MIH17_18570 [Marinobacter sp. M2C]UQG68459.1 hypothetical protein MIH19_18580 [Marinobacter sp. M1C]